MVTVTSIRSTAPNPGLALSEPLQMFVNQFANDSVGEARMTFKTKRNRNYTKFKKKSPAGRASDYFVHSLEALAEVDKPASEIVVAIYLRVSGRFQNYRGTHAAQLAGIKRELKLRGINRYKTFREVGPGWDTSEFDRIRLVQAARFASQHDGLVVALSAGRYLRNEFYKISGIDRLPTIDEYEELSAMVRRISPNVTLATILDPDMPPRKVRGIESSLGQQIEVDPNFRTTGANFLGGFPGSRSLAGVDGPRGAIA